MNLTTGIISGTPTDGGTTSVDITAYEHANFSGHQLSFTLNFTIAGGASAPVITGQPSDVRVHAGEAVTLTVAASGTPPLTYQWKHDGQDLVGQTSATLDVPSASPGDAGSYVVTVSGSGASVTSTPAAVTVVPLSIQMSGWNASGVTILLQTIPGRSYTVEAADVAVGAVWQLLGTITASSGTTSYVDSAIKQNQRFWRYSVAP